MPEMAPPGRFVVEVRSGQTGASLRPRWARWVQCFCLGTVGRGQVTAHWQDPERWNRAALRWMWILHPRPQSGRWDTKGFRRQEMTLDKIQCQQQQAQDVCMHCTCTKNARPTKTHRVKAACARATQACGLETAEIARSGNSQLRPGSSSATLAGAKSAARRQLMNGCSIADCRLRIAG